MYGRSKVRSAFPAMHAQLAALCAILGHRFTAGQSLTTSCFSLRTTHVGGTGFKTTERLREPSAADEPFRLDDGTELVPHQHCNWGSSVAFDGDRGATWRV